MTKLSWVKAEYFKNQQRKTDQMKRIFTTIVAVLALISIAMSKEPEDQQCKEAFALIAFIERPYELDPDYKGHIPFKFYFIKGIGELFIYFIPKTKKLQNYYDTFIVRNKIEAFDGEMDYEITEAGKIRVNNIIKKKFISKEYDIVGVCTPWAMMEPASSPLEMYEYVHIDWPYTNYIYYYDENVGWRYISEQIIPSWDKESDLSYPDYYRRYIPDKAKQ